MRPLAFYPTAPMTSRRDEVGTWIFDGEGGYEGLIAVLQATSTLKCEPDEEQACRFQGVESGSYPDPIWEWDLHGFIVETWQE